MGNSYESGGAAADAIVVGGGVAGLAAARELARKGLRVVVLDEGGRAGSRASSAAGGMLAPQAEANARDELFELLCASRDMYPSFAEELREESGIDIGLEMTGTLYLALTRADEEELERRYAWQSLCAGLEVERLSADEARALEPAVSPRVRMALRFPRDWQVENRLLVEALALSAERLGARILTGTRALGVRVVAGRVTGVESSRGFKGAGAVVLAAGAWSSRVPLLVSEREGAAERTVTDAHPPVEPVRGQMLCFAQPTGEAFMRHVVYSPRGYLVPRRDGRLLAGSTTERVGFDCFVTAEGVRAVTAQALEIAPGVEGLRLTESWAGLRPHARDGRPVLGESAEARGLFYDTAHYRNGILLAPATGRLVADLLTGGATCLAPRTLEAFSPARFGGVLASSNAK